MEAIYSSETYVDIIVLHGVVYEIVELLCSVTCLSQVTGVKPC
jgi:hypothetical protein